MKMNALIPCLFLSTALTLFAESRVSAQVIKRKVEEAKNKSTERADMRTSEGIDRGLNKIEEGVGNLFKKKKPKSEDANDAEKSNNTDNPSPSNKGGMANGDSGSPSANKSLQTYSKFDFIAGEKVLYYEDFSTVSIGDFPKFWNTDAGGEVVELEGSTQRYLNLTKNGYFVPEALGALPENCTIEMDLVVVGDPSNNEIGFGLHFRPQLDMLLDWNPSKLSSIDLHPGAGSATVTVHQEDQSPILKNQTTTQWNVGNQTMVRLSLWKQKSRLRVYINEQKIFDLPKFFAAQEPYYLRFCRGFFAEAGLLIGDFRFAVGAPDTRNALLTQGKFVTRGILFATGSARIEPASFGTLQEIAQVLKANPELKVKIVGHTDSDGNPSTNQQLSEKRAAAVQEALIQQFGLDAQRFSTEGKGASEPVDDNNNPIGKANNRRVEFIRIN